MSRPTDRDLLFGLLALQLNFIDRDALVGAFDRWIVERSRPLDRILLERGALSPGRHQLLAGLVEEHIKLHGDDPEKSLQHLSSIGSVREDLARLADADLHASLAHVSAAHPVDDPFRTVTQASLGEASSIGSRFRVLRPHAKGGLGQVSVALDQELDRAVALKEIQERHADEPLSRARFVQEAEITGKLEHPGIIPVYGLGHDATGRPFYAMRFIHGDSLKEAIAAFHGDERLKKDPIARTTRLRELLRRFTDVCNAVAYAHSRGVLHRDIKPGNIMLGPYGETLVVDWGLAKPIGEPMSSESARGDGPSPMDGPIRLSGQSGSRAETVAGATIGTPAYASPEQLTGALHRLGPASDVYGLGATLYSLLTGRAPIVSNDLGEIIGRVERGEVPPPRSIDPTIPRPLEAICRKAMTPRPEDRYESARALANDVTRWLDDEPVTACREPIASRVRRWMKRNRTLVTSSAVALVLIAGYYVRQRQAYVRQRQAQALRLAVALRDVEVLRRQAEADPMGDPEKWRTAAAAAERAAELLDTLIGGPSQRAVRELREQLGRSAKAGGADAKPLRDAADIRPAGADDPSAWRDTLAALERSEGREPAAPVEALLREIRDRVEAAERSARLRQELIEVRANQSDIGLDGTDAAYATAFGAAGLDLDSLGPAEFARRLRLRRGEVAAIELSAFLDDWSAARRAARGPVAAWRRPLEAARLADHDPYRDRLRTILLAEDLRREAGALKTLAAAPEAAGLPAPTAVLLGRSLAAARESEAAVVLLRTAALRHPGDFWVNHDLASALANLRPSAREEAVGYYRAARALRPETEHQLAHLLERMGRGAEAEAVLRDLADRRPGDARHLVCLADHLQQRGRTAVAAPILERAVVAARSAVRLRPDLAHSHNNLGNALVGHGKADEAIAEYREAIRLKPDYAEAHCNLGRFLRSRGDYSGSLAMYRKGHELGRRQPGWRYPSAQWVAEAERLAALASRLPALLKGEDRPKDMVERLALAQMCYDAKRHAAAARFWSEALAADPKLGENLRAGYRYNAACAAALAGCRPAEDRSTDEAEKTRWRKQAVAWLRVDLAAWTRQVESGPPAARAVVNQVLGHWKEDADLAGLRDEAAVKALPEDEQKTCRRLWADVDALLTRSRRP